MYQCVCLCVSFFRLKVDELALPQPVEEQTLLETQHPGIRREDSGSGERLQLLVRQPAAVEEHGQPAEEDVQRTPEHGTHKTQKTCACASWSITIV